jgi:beta propeller repeat protein/parallel beta-helix repeat protein
VYIGCTNTYLYAIDATSGSLLWDYALNGEILTTPAVANGKVYIASAGATGKLYAINTGSHEEDWELDSPNSGGFTSSPAVTGNLVFIGTGSGENISGGIVAYDAQNGDQMQWNPSYDGGGVESAPVVSGGVMYASAGNSGIGALNGDYSDSWSSGYAWTFWTGSTVRSSPVVADGSLYFGCGDGNIYALKGTPQISNQWGSMSVDTDPVRIGDSFTVHVQSQPNQTFFLIINPSWDTVVESDDQIPVIASGQPGVNSSMEAHEEIAHVYSQYVSRSSWVYDAIITTDEMGMRNITFNTGELTKDATFQIELENENSPQFIQNIANVPLTTRFEVPPVTGPQETRIPTNGGVMYNYGLDPAIDGDRIVWTDYRNGNAGIYLYTITTGIETQVTPNSSSAYNPAISGDRIVYYSYRDGNSDIYFYNITTGIETQVTTGTSYSYSPSLSGDRIVYYSYRNGNSNIYFYNITTGIETQVTTGTSWAYNPVISGNQIVWEDGRNGNADIYSYNITTGMENPVCTDSATQENPVVSGNHAVWSDYRNGYPDLYLYTFGPEEVNLPTARFNANITFGTVPLMVQFTDTSTGLPTSWNWSFGDGNFSEIQNPVHTYAFSGIFSVSMNATNAGGSNVTLKTNYIIVAAPKPLPDFSADVTSGVTPLPISFTDLSTNTPTGWAWFFGDENYTQPWTQQTGSAGWSARFLQNAVVLPDGSIVLIGGNDDSVGNRNDVWRSTNNGATWTQQTGSAGWSARYVPSSVVLSDDSIVLMGGDASGSDVNDVWRSTDKGVTWTQQTAHAEWSERFYPSSVVLPDGSIVLMSGETIDGKSNDVWRSMDKGVTWTEVNASAGWSARRAISSVAMPDGSIVLMGGTDGESADFNDVWRSIDNGTTWIQVNASAGWSARAGQSSVAMPDGSIVLMGGWDSIGKKNDVWRFTPTGSSEQNPSHTYTSPGNYTVALQASNAGGYNSTRKVSFINVSSAGWDGASCTVITMPGTYRIFGDIQGTPGITCIDIRSSDVLIRGGGHTLNGTFGSLGIGATASPDIISNVMVRNLTLTNWSRGIVYENVTGGTIENSTVLFSEMEGITLLDSSFITLTRDNASGNGLTGVAVIEGSDHNTLNSVNANGNGAVGVWLYAASHNTIQSGTFNQNNGGGLTLEARSSDNTISGNTADFNTNGITIRANSGFISPYPYGPSDNNTVLSNDASSNSNNGISLFEEANNNTIFDNTAFGNRIGINLNGLPSVLQDNDITANNVSLNTRHGLVVDNSTGTQLFTNKVVNNLNHGISLRNSFNTTIAGNKLRGNSIRGIALNASFNTTVKGNIIEFSAVGLGTSSGASNATVYNNYFNNTENIRDFEGVNIWNITRTAGTNIIGGPFIAGNSWSDYTGFDTDSDRIGDTLVPYRSNGNITFGGDWLPLTNTTGPVANGTIIDQSATLYIGEQGLDVTHALNQAQGSPMEGIPPLTRIGWWASGTPPSGFPSMTIDLSGRYTSFNVSQTEFEVRTGNWYVLQSDGVNIAGLAFTVADPTLDIKVWDFDHGSDVTGTSIPRGTLLGFRIDTNMNGSVYQRTPLDPTTDGFIDIKVINASGVTYPSLYHYSTNESALAGPSSILANYVNVQPYYWGSPLFAWNTSARDNGTYIYPDGTYTVKAESTLHDMKDNYRNAGADYEGKTVSLSYTITIASASMAPVASFTTNVTSGTVPFAVQFTDTSTGVPTAWNWTFGDGSFSTLQNTSYVYTTPGIYTVFLNATNAGGSNISTRTNYIVVNVPKPIPGFSANITTGIVPLPISFTDSSTNVPTGWAWFFGDENYTAPWTQQTASAGWSGRNHQSSVGLPDGSIVLMGGDDGSTKLHDVWRSTNNGVTWTQVNASAGWSGRYGQSSVAMPDGSIVLMGGYTGGTYLNDVWRSTDNGATWTQVNASAGWSARRWHSSVVTPDGSIVLMGGWDGSYKNDVWRSTNNGVTWTQVNASAGWSARDGQGSVVTPDGSIVLMGGYTSTSPYYKNDVWRSMNNGVTWTQLNASAGWSARRWVNSIVMPDGSIVLMGSYDGTTQMHDVWRSIDNGATWAQVTANAGWTGRYGQSSVALPDGSIVLMGGWDTTSYLKNDVWRLMPTGSSVQNPSHTYASPGNYTVALQAYNAGGYNSTRNIGYINVTAATIAPVASFTTNRTSGSTPLTVQFNDTSTNSPTSWYWIFGDGGTSIAQNVTHTYNSVGSYTVNMSASNAGGTTWSNVTNKITVLPPAPVASFTGTPASGTSPLTVSFTDSSSNSPTGWAWFFGDENYTAPWTQVNASAGWTARYGHSSVVMPDGSIVLMGGFNGATRFNDVWRSTDDGITWTRVNASAGWSGRYGHRSVVLPDGSIVLMGGYDGSTQKNDVWRSTDNGATWSQVNASAGWLGRSGHTSVVMPDGSIVLMGGYVAGQVNDTWRSTDKGATWTRMNASSGWTVRSDHSSVALPDGSIVLMGGSGNNNNVWRSTDNGATWTQVTASAEWAKRYGHMSVVMPDGSIVLMGGYDASAYRDVWRSTDYGAHWTQVNASAGWSARSHFSSVVTRDGSIVLMGGFPSPYFNDVWRFNPIGSSAQNPSHTYAAAGNYTVALQSYNAGGFNSTIRSGYINVSSITPPVASFTSNLTSGTAPLIVQFNDTSTNTPTAWNWTFGDGTFSVQQNPVHVYASSGTYTVALNATNAGGSNVATLTNYITVNPPATVAGFTGVPTSGTVPLTVIFTDSSTNTPTSWNWTFGDGSLVNATVQNPVHTYASAGTFTVILNATNAGGFNVSTRTNYITVNPPAPVAGFTANQTSGTAPLAVLFSDSSTNIPTSWNWSFRNVTGNNTQVWWSTVQNATQTFGAGNFFIALNATNSGGYNVSTQVTFINVSAAVVAPVAGFTGVPASGTAPLTVIFTDSSTNTPTSWNWTFGDGSLVNATVQNPVHTYTSAGTFTVSLNAINAGGSNVATQTNYITVNPPAPVAGFTGVPASGTAPLTVIFTDSSTNTPTSWNWTFGDGSLVNATVQNPVHTYASAGIYTVALNATNAGGSNTSVQTGYITVNVPAPVANFMANVTSGVQPLTIQFTDTTTGSPTSWNWTFGDGNFSVLQNPVHVYASSGTFTVSLNATNAGGSNVSVQTNYITVNGPAPVAGFTSNVTSGTVPFAVQFYDTSTGSPVNWSWNFGDGNTSTDQNPVHTFVWPQAFNVVLTVANSGGLTNSSTVQVTGYTPQVNTITALNGTTESTAGGNQTVSVNATALEDTGGSVTTTNTTITVTGGNAFWQTTQMFAENVTVNATTGDYTITNVTQVIMQSAPVTATLNQSVGNVSVSLDVALRQYVSDAAANITITQGATTNTVNAFQLAAQNSSINITDIAYTVQFTNTEAINANLTQNATMASRRVVLTMSVSHTWVQQFANSTNNDGRGSIIIIRYPETGVPTVLATRYVYTDSNNLDWFEGDSPNGLSIFGMIGYAAAEAASPASGNTGSQAQSSSNSGSSGGGSGSAANHGVAGQAQNAPVAAQHIFQGTAPLQTDKSGQTAVEVQVQSSDLVASLTLPQGIQATDRSGQPLAEVSIQPMGSSSVPSTEDGSQYAFSGLAYQCGPDGAQFSPAITITFTLSENQWNILNANGREPVIREYSTSTNTWETLQTKTDPATRSVSASATHFSDFAVFSEPVQNRGTSAITPALTAQAASKPPANAFEIVINLGSWGAGFLVKNLVLMVICIVLIGIGYAGWVWYRRKKKQEIFMYGKQK